MSRVFTTRYRRQMEAKLRAAERKEDKKRNRRGARFTKRLPPLLVTFQKDTGKMPHGFPIHLPHDTAIAAIHRGRTVALPVRSFDAVPDFVVDEDNLEHAGLEFAVA
jgi:hypothetical protein